MSPVGVVMMIMGLSCGRPGLHVSEAIRAFTATHPDGSAGMPFC